MIWGVCKISRGLWNPSDISSLMLEISADFRPQWSGWFCLLSPGFVPPWEITCLPSNRIDSVKSWVARQRLTALSPSNYPQLSAFIFPCPMWWVGYTMDHPCSPRHISTPLSRVVWKRTCPAKISSFCLFVLFFSYLIYLFSLIVYSCFPQQHVRGVCLCDDRELERVNFEVTFFYFPVFLYTGVYLKEPLLSLFISKDGLTNARARSFM